MMDVVCRADGQTESAIHGMYAEDPSLAVSSAETGFNRLLGYRALRAPNNEAALMRKDYGNETNPPIVLRVRH